MKDEKAFSVSQLLKQIARNLVLHGSSYENPGLWYGKTGMAVFLFHYGRYSGNKQFDDYAIEMISSIQEGLHWGSEVNYKNGLAGIGAGIEYLSQNGFLDIDTNEILEDFDPRIRDEILYRKHDNKSLGMGLCGLGQYLLYRINYSFSGVNELRLLTNRERILYVVNIIENEGIPPTNELPDVLLFLCRLYHLDICNPKIERYLDKLLKEFSYNDIRNGNQSAWVLALLRLISIRNQTVNLIERLIVEVLQSIDSTDALSTNNGFADTVNRLLWLLQCKKLIKKTCTNTNIYNHLEILTDKTIRQATDSLGYEKNTLSLMGYSGAGLALMTVSGDCDDTWLDLLM